MGGPMKPPRRETRGARRTGADMMRTAEKIFYVLAIPVTGFALYQLLKLWMKLN